MAALKYEFLTNQMEEINHIKNREIIIRKASGEEELFSPQKLERSLMNAGVNYETAVRIVADIVDWIIPGVTTQKIYSRAFSMLRRERTNAALRYKLKKAILELGPTGYPFEALIGQLFERMGYISEVGVIVEGNCISHEMDVIATNENTQHLVECKYHKDQGKQVSIQVPLYVRSRVDDIVRRRENMPEFSGLDFTGWVITNTRFSTDSIQYGKCNGLKLLAWDYPQGLGLKELLENYKIYPVTVLRKLTSKEKQKLLKHGIVSCSQLLMNQDLLKEFNLTKSKHRALLDEINDICT